MAHLLHTNHERYDTAFFRQCFLSAAYLTVAKTSALYFRSEDVPESTLESDEPSCGGEGRGPAACQDHTDSRPGFRHPNQCAGGRAYRWDCTVSHLSG